MFLFQLAEGSAPRPVSRFGSASFLESKGTEFFIYGGGGLSSSGSTLELKPTLVRQGIRASAGVRKGVDGGDWKPLFEFATFGRYGTLGMEPGVWSAGTHHGVSAYYGQLTDNKITFESSGGPLGNILAGVRAQQHLATGHSFFSMPFTRVFGAIKAVADFGYSAVKRGIEAIWPDIRDGQEQPGAETLKRARDGNAADLEITECLKVMLYKKGDIDDRKKAGVLLEAMLVSDMQKLASGSAKLSLSDWDNLMPILEKGRMTEENGKPVYLISSNGWANIRYGLDVLRMNLGGEETFKFIKNMAGAGGVASLLGGTMANYLSVDEYSIGKPLNLRWHGWNLPMTIIDTVGGWFEGMFDFRRTREEGGFFGKLLGFAEDLGNVVISPVSKAIGSVLPIYRRSEGRATEAAENARSALAECERLAAKTILAPEEAVKLNSDATYLNAMLPVLRRAGEDGLADRIAGHFSEPKNELLYEVLSCEMTRREANLLNQNLEGKWVKDAGTRAAMEQRLALKRLQLVQSYSYLKLKSEEIKQKQVEARAKGGKYFESREEAAILVSVDKEIVAIEKDCRSGKHPDLMAQGKDFDRILGSLQQGKQMGEDWSVVAGLLRRGERAPTREEAEAAARFSTVINYANAYETVRVELDRWAARQDQGAVDEVFEKAEDRASDLMDELDKDAGDLKNNDEREKYAQNVSHALGAMNNLNLIGFVFGRASKEAQGWPSDEIPKAMETLYGIKGKLDEERGDGEDSRENAQVRGDLEGAMVLLYRRFGQAALEKLDDKQKDFVIGLEKSPQFAQG